MLATPGDRASLMMCSILHVGECLPFGESGWGKARVRDPLFLLFILLHRWQICVGTVCLYILYLNHVYIAKAQVDLHNNVSLFFLLEYINNLYWNGLWWRLYFHMDKFYWPKYKVSKNIELNVSTVTGGVQILKQCHSIGLGCSFSCKCVHL